MKCRHHRSPMKPKPGDLERTRMYKIILLVVVVLLLIPLLTHYYLNKVGVDETFNVEQDINSHPWIVQLADVDKLKGAELKFRIEELLRIKFSVTSELRDLEAKRQHVQSEIALLNRRLEEAKMEAGKRRNELDRLQISLQQAKVAEKEAMERNTPRLGRPKPLVPLRSIPIYPMANEFNKSPSGSNIDQCQMDSCFDYSLCPMTSPFYFYSYTVTDYLNFTKSLHISENGDSFKSSDNRVTNLQEVLRNSQYFTRDFTKACLFVLVIDDCEPSKIAQIHKTLPRWFGDGRNHVIWLSCKNPGLYKQILQTNFLDNFGRALIATETAFRGSFRSNFDVVMSHWRKALPNGEVWAQLPPMVPAKRKYLATYLGGETDHYVQSELLKIQQDDPQSFVFQFSCNIPLYQGKKAAPSEENSLHAAGSNKGDGDKGGRSADGSANGKLSSLCENDLLRTRLLIDSTFSLIILPPEDLTLISSDILQQRLYESLKYGAIPIVIGSRFEPPFTEVIDWSKIILSLPSARITEMHYLLKSIMDTDLLALRRSGRQVFENYLSTMERATDTLLGSIRSRIGVPPNPFKEFPSPSVFNETFTPLKLDTFTVDPEEEENLGPIEPPYPSVAFARNYSMLFIQKYDYWNTYYQPFKLYPYSPWDLTMPSEAKFRGSSLGFRPIAAGAGGSGKEFSQSIGGNLPKEQFSIVMLTYEREQVLMNSLQRLFGLPYLNKVVVVWNSPQSPLSDLRWPDIGVPIHIIKAAKNSLNNRFIPYDVIETEAILSIDDDAHLRHDEIVFGFRVWRENRDRIVGFPGRYHAWDLNSSGGWLYNSNYSCELSMVLTGAAFYHKMYSYLYTYEMPSAIRDKVDELMNCEDIAMNFLVSHVTQKPPVKVTSRWTFRCPGCPVTLSEDDSHFQERHHCINFFSQVYGYTPLLYTQFRADSILFKTRIPHDKQKCFKYI